MTAIESMGRKANGDLEPDRRAAVVIETGQACEAISRDD